MGFFIIVIAAVAVIVAAAMDFVLVGLSAAIVAKSARMRRNAWTIAGVVCALTTILTIIAVLMWPYQTVRPGSDYEIATLNICIQAGSCTLSFGIGAVFGAIAAWLFAGKTSASAPSNSPVVN